MNGTTDIFGNSLKYWSDIAAIELRNIEAFSLAQQKMLEGWGLLAQRQAEMVQGTLRRSFDSQGQGTPTATVGPAAMIGQIDSFKTSILENQANSNILTELATRSSGEVASILQSRFVAALDEYKAALGHVAPTGVPK